MTEERQTFLGWPGQVQLVRVALAAVIRAVARRAHRRLITAITTVILAVAVSVDRHTAAVPTCQLGQPTSAATNATADDADTTTATAAAAAATATAPAAYTTPDAAAVRRVSD